MNQTAKLLLDDTRAAWSTASSDSAAVHARGYAFVGDDFYEGQALADFIHRHCTKSSGEFIDELRELIPRLNGGWGLAVKLPDGRSDCGAGWQQSHPDLLIVGNGGALARGHALPQGGVVAGESTSCPQCGCSRAAIQVIECSPSTADLRTIT